MEKQKDINRKEVSCGRSNYLMPWGTETTAVLTAESRRVCVENEVEFNWYYLTPDATIIAIQLPMSTAARLKMADTLKQLGYDAIDKKMVEACGLNHDPEKKGYFAIANTVLGKMHLS